MQPVQVYANFILLIDGYLHESQSLCNIHIPHEIFELISKFYPLTDKVKYHHHYEVPGISSTEWEINTEHVFESLKISEFGSMRSGNKYDYGALIITVHHDLILEKYATIHVNGKGYKGGGFGENGKSALNNKYGGKGAMTYANCGGGGGYATSGSDGDDYDNDGNNAKGGDSFGNAICRYLYGGSGGGGSRVSSTRAPHLDMIGGCGGGILIIRVYGSLILHQYSSIEANGETGYASRDGCGSGGTILIFCTNLKINQYKITDTLIVARGAENKRGLTGYYGGTGGDGRIVIQCGNKKQIAWKNICLPHPYLM